MKKLLFRLNDWIRRPLILMCWQKQHVWTAILGAKQRDGTMRVLLQCARCRKTRVMIYKPPHKRVRGKVRK